MANIIIWTEANSPHIANITKAIGGIIDRCFFPVLAHKLCSNDRCSWMYSVDVHPGELDEVCDYLHSIQNGADGRFFFSTCESVARE